MPPDVNGNPVPIPIHDFAGAQYYGPVSVGTPPQSFMVIIPSSYPSLYTLTLLML
jgi:hypothetical protein